MKHRSLLLWSEVLLTTPPCPHLFMKSMNWPRIHRKLPLRWWFPHMSRVEQCMNLGVQVGGWSSNIQSCLCCLARSITTARYASWDISLFNVKKAYSNRPNRKQKSLNRVKGQHLTLVVRICIQRRTGWRKHFTLFLTPHIVRGSWINQEKTSKLTAGIRTAVILTHLVQLLIFFLG